MPSEAPRDLEGRVFLVTGATSGVGRGAVWALRARGAEVIGASRAGAAGDASSGLPLDLCDPASIRAATARLRAERPHLDGVVHGAGAFVWKPEPTPFGVDRAWAVNYLGHVLLTRELWPLLEAAPSPRVITVAGSPGFLRRLPFEPTFLDAPPTSGLRAAGTALAARVVWTSTLARRHATSRVVPLSFHPGLVRSHLGAEGPFLWRFVTGLTNRFASPECRVVGELAARSTLERGAYFDHHAARQSIAKLEDPALGDRLWSETEKRLG